MTHGGAKKTITSFATLQPYSTFPRRTVGTSESHYTLITRQLEHREHENPFDRNLTTLVSPNNELNKSRFGLRRVRFALKISSCGAFAPLKRSVKKKRRVGWIWVQYLLKYAEIKLKSQISAAQLGVLFPIVNAVYWKKNK